MRASGRTERKSRTGLTPRAVIARDGGSPASAVAQSESGEAAELGVNPGYAARTETAPNRRYRKIKQKSHLGNGSRGFRASVCGARGRASAKRSNPARRGIPGP